MAHRLGRRAEEMLTVVPALVSVAGEPQPRLMDERRRLQGLAGGFVGHPGRREPPQFVIDQREQLLGGLRVARLSAVEDVCHVGHG